MQCLKHRTAEVGTVRAVAEPALPEIRSKPRKTALELRRGYAVGFPVVKRGETRRVRHYPAALQVKQLHVTRRVLSSAQAFAEEAGGSSRLRIYAVEQAGLAHPALPGKRGHTAG